ncbi:tetraacyldisaccharide 4'-kinase [bacterium]|nr:MAG: tetraacyldisaccharide 4'-kinase [bacterium]
MGLTFRTILWPFSLLYGIAVGVRNRFFDRGRLPSVAFGVPVISVGNITAGGTGKTPHVEYLAALLSGRHRVAVLSRGYGRKTGGFILLGKNSKASEAGDEPVQIKRKFPGIEVAVCNDRVQGIKKLLEMDPAPEIILLDDAFQHRYVKPRVSVLLVNYNRPVFRDMLLPAGNLREPWKNAKRADIVIVTKCTVPLPGHEMSSFVSKLKVRDGQSVYFTTYAYGEPVFLYPGDHAQHEDLTFGMLQKQGAGILLVTGVADPRPLKDFLSGKAEVSASITYGDHHNFTAADIGNISAKFGSIRKDKKYIMVTEKDAVRIADMKISDKKLREALCYIPVKVKFLAGGEASFTGRLEYFLKKQT